VDSEQPAPAYAVISPSGDVTWYPLRAEREVEALVAGKYAGALDRRFVTGPLRLVASDVALLFPEDFPENPAAGRIITALSGGRVSQPWRGHVALTEYDRDPGTREWLWPTEISENWQQKIREAATGS
jgi:hypothetical protein